VVQRIFRSHRLSLFQREPAESGIHGDAVRRASRESPKSFQRGTVLRQPTQKKREPLRTEWRSVASCTSGLAGPISLAPRSILSLIYDNDRKALLGNGRAGLMGENPQSMKPAARSATFLMDDYISRFSTSNFPILPSRAISLITTFATAGLEATSALTRVTVSTPNSGPGPGPLGCTGDWLME
jgi:hypothetical protein